MTTKEHALDAFLNGHNCSQAVLDAYAGQFKLDPETARRLAAGLGGGAGVNGHCGAVSAALLVLSLRYGFSDTGESGRMRGLIARNQEFCNAFRQKHGHIDCFELLGFDLFSELGQKQFAKNNMKKTVCAGFVADAVEILETLIGHAAGQSEA